MPDDVSITAPDDEDEIESPEDRRFRELAETNLEQWTLADWGFVARLIAVFIASRVADELLRGVIHRLAWSYQVPGWITLVALVMGYEVWRQKPRSPSEGSALCNWRDLSALLGLAAVFGAAAWAFFLLWDRLGQIDWLVTTFGVAVISGALALLVWLVVDERKRRAGRSADR